MKFKVMSRKDAERFDSDRSHITISITDPDASLATFFELDSRKALLRLQFHDIDKTPEEMREIGWVDLTLFTAEDANRIKAFVEENSNEVEFIVCHCEAGVSRSAGVAAALALVLNGENDDFFDFYLPNSRVYNKILEAYYGRPFIS